MLVNWQLKILFWLFIRIFIMTAQKQNQDSNFPKYYFLPIRGHSWHKNEIKMIMRGNYCSNDFQDSKKNRNKTLGYLPRVLFFNAFELGAEKVSHQVLSSEDSSTP